MQVTTWIHIKLMKKILSERFTYLNSIIFKILKTFSKHNIKQDCDIKIKSLNQQYNIDNKKKQLPWRTRDLDFHEQNLITNNDVHFMQVVFELQRNLYNATGEVLLKAHKFYQLCVMVFTKSCLFSLSWKPTCLERPHNLVVVLYRFYCTSEDMEFKTWWNPCNWV